MLACAYRMFENPYISIGLIIYGGDFTTNVGTGSVA